MAHRAGLGDTNYETYQQMPRRLEERLLELGAACFYKRGEADDATGCLHLLLGSRLALCTPDSRAFSADL
jgi:sulfite reductase alpha subunit-like flavoprotein